MRALKMAVDHLRDIDRFADAPVGGGIENEILQPEAASLIEAQPQQRGAAVEGVPDKLRAAVCQKGAVAAAAKLDCAGLPGGMRLLDHCTVRALAQQLIAAAHDVRAGILRRLQQQLERPLPEQVIIIAEGQKFSACCLQPAVAGRTDPCVFLGYDMDALVFAGQRMAYFVRCIRGAIVDDDDLQPRHLLRKNRLDCGAQRCLGVVRRDNHTEFCHDAALPSQLLFELLIDFPVGQRQRSQPL